MTCPIKTTRRDFIRFSSGVLRGSLVPAPLVALQAAEAWAKNTGLIFLEAEQFADIGGWDTDQQSMDQMGSSSPMTRLHMSPPIGFGWHC